jgi:hypothetical protein
MENEAKRVFRVEHMDSSSEEDRSGDSTGMSTRGLRAGNLRGLD